jgi:hypothetical protein
LVCEAGEGEKESRRVVSVGCWLVLVGCLVGWSAGWLVGWLDWLVGWFGFLSGKFLIMRTLLHSFFLSKKLNDIPDA